MNTGIIVYSQTGNTIAVGEKLMDKLRQKGHDVEVERVTTAGEKPPKDNQFQLKNIPSVKEYDHLIFAAPVHAFSIAPVMNAYLNDLPDLTGKTSHYLLQNTFL